jgi:hypothetical protein
MPMKGRSFASGVCLLAGLLGFASCADRAPSPPSTPTSPTIPATPSGPIPPPIEVCAYVPDAPTAVVDAVGGRASAVVRTASPCRWTAVTGSAADSWIKIESQAAGLGPGVVAFTLQPNRSLNGRSGTIVIRNDSGEVLATHAVTQRAAGCLYSVTPATQTFDWMGTYDGAGDSPKAIEVHAQPAGCQWTATPSVPWIRVVYNKDRGTGNSTIYVSLVQWNSGSSRVGEVVVAGLSGVNPDARLAVTQGVR